MGYHSGMRDRAQLLLQDLLDRGWSRQMVDQLLGEPDQLRPNRKHRGRHMRLYAARRVAAAVAILGLLGFLALWYDNAAAKQAARDRKGD